jgi:Icc protein
MLPMKIAQITDLHLCRGLSWDVDVAANLQKVLEDVAGRKVGLVVVTGDLVKEDRDEQSYVAVKERLDACGFPYRVTPGNHDDRAILSRVFGLAPRPSGEIYDAESLGGVELLFLDSSQAAFSPAQWAWLAKRVKATREAAYLFMHHPPVPAGVPIMDGDWRFLQAEEFRSRLLSPPKTVAVFCGHYHAEKFVRLPGLELFLCPAAIFQFDPEEGEFRVGSLRYGWREIEIDGGRLATGVRWIER